MAISESDIAAQLIERLLADPAFRTEFRRDPAAACRQAGLDSLADEMALGAGKAMMTLDVRESKSSLAGVMMAAAMEGVGVYQFGENVLPHLAEVPDSVSDVLSRVNLPALPGRGALDGAPAPPAAPPAESNGAEAGADAGGGGGAAAAAAAAPAPSVEALPPEAAAEGGKEAAEKAAAAAKEAGAKGAEGKEAVLPPEQAAVKKIVEAESPEAKREAEIKEAVDEIEEDAKDLPSASSFPDSAVAPQEVEEVGPGAGQKPPQADAAPAPAGQPAAPAPAAPAAPVPAAPAAAVEAPAGGGKPIDPDQFGGEGTGGTPSPEAQALLTNKNVILDETGISDIKEGRIDPRVVAVLTKLSQEHEIKVSCMCSDHSKFTAGGSISNHFHGRGLDIAAIDGEIVNPGSAIARELATEFQDLDPNYRPDEIGTPWAISGPGYFTDAGHQDHLHVGFKTEIDPNWKPPADVAAGGAAAQPVAAAAAAAPGQPVAAQAAAAPQVKKGDSMAFTAVKAEAAAEAPKKGDSMAFMPAIQPAAVAAGTAPTPAGPASALASAAVPGAVAPAAAAPGGSALGAAALQVAQGELGVKEEGYNTGVDVDKYLAAAGVAPGNPWCASFVTWALGESGKKMEGGGWAAVQTWVRTAEQGNQGLQIVSAEEARPGDIVAYDWGGQDDFGADGHIGFLESKVEGGKFTALEGNYQDAVLRAPRSVGSANVKFIRVTGDAPASVPGAPPVAAVAPPSGPIAPAAAVEGGPGSAEAAAPAPPAAVEGGPGSADAAAPPQPPPAAPAAPAAAAAAAPVDPAAAAKAAEAVEAKKQDSLAFKALRPETSRKSGVTVQFMKAIDPSSAKSASSDAPAAAAAAAAPAPGPAAPSAAADAAMVQAVGAPVPADELALQSVGPIGTYPGDNAGKPAIAKWLADEAERAGLPRELPVMAALVESDVQNLKGGDADSAGFFQMRVGIWDTGQYKGYRMNPNLQAKWFIDHALAVKKASGDPDFGKNPADWGNWIADVERPAAQYRYKYATRLADARALLKQS